ncbi:hypothetical protein C8R44DRAFT_741060 [Mycena epipterygia]|nr:hypothetical protein C8R44DRAFT_741060 [Mycena epipterygia]
MGRLMVTALGSEALPRDQSTNLRRDRSTTSGRTALWILLRQRHVECTIKEKNETRHGIRPVLSASTIRTATSEDYARQTCRIKLTRTTRAQNGTQRAVHRRTTSVILRAKNENINIDGYKRASAERSALRLACILGKSDTASPHKGSQRNRTGKEREKRGPDGDGEESGEAHGSGRSGKRQQRDADEREVGEGRTTQKMGEVRRQRYIEEGRRAKDVGRRRRAEKKDAKILGREEYAQTRGAMPPGRKVAGEQDERHRRGKARDGGQRRNVAVGGGKNAGCEQQHDDGWRGRERREEP